MKSLGISFRWGKAKYPQATVKLNGWGGTEELKQVLLAIEDCLKKNFPSVQVKRSRYVTALLQGRRQETIRGLETPKRAEEERKQPEIPGIEDEATP